MEKIDILNLLCKGRTLRTSLSNPGSPKSPAHELDIIINSIKIEFGLPIQNGLKTGETVLDGTGRANLLSGDYYHLDEVVVEELRAFFDGGLCFTSSKEEK